MEIKAKKGSALIKMLRDNLLNKKNVNSNSLES